MPLNFDLNSINECSAIWRSFGNKFSVSFKQLKLKSYHNFSRWRHIRPWPKKTTDILCRVRFKKCFEAFSQPFFLNDVTKLVSKLLRIAIFIRLIVESILSSFYQLPIRKFIRAPPDPRPSLTYFQVQLFPIKSTACGRKNQIENIWSYFKL